MTMTQRTVWAQLLVYPAVGLAYFGVVLSRAADAPVAEVSWVVPLIWAMAVLILGIVGLTIVGAIGHGVRATYRGDTPEFDEGDVRDREIERDGDYRSRHIIASGGLAVIVLAMVGADHFWIANAMFLAGLVAGIYATVIKLRLYRQGW